MIQDTIDELKESSDLFNLSHVNILSQLYLKTKKSYNLYESDFFYKFKELKTNINDKNIIETIDNAMEMIKSESKGEQINYCFAHGDFTPWNIKIYKEKLYIYDWELSQMKPIYNDLFHFIFFNSLLVKKYNSQKIINEIFRNDYIDKFENINTINYNKRKYMFAIYLIEIIYFYSILMNENYKENNIIINCLKTLKLLINM